MSTEFITNEWDAYMDSEPTTEWEAQARNTGKDSLQRTWKQPLQMDIYAPESEFAGAETEYLPTITAQEAQAIESEAIEMEPFPGIALHDVTEIESEVLGSESIASAILRAAALRTPVQNLLLTPATARALRKAGLRTLADLVALSPLQISELPGLGKKGVAEVEQLVEQFALPMESEISEPPIAPERAPLPEDLTDREPLPVLPVAVPEYSTVPGAPLTEVSFQAIEQGLEENIGEAMPTSQLCLPLIPIAFITQPACRDRKKLPQTQALDPTVVPFAHNTSSPRRKRTKRLPSCATTTETTQTCLDYDVFEKEFASVQSN